MGCPVCRGASHTVLVQIAERHAMERVEKLAPELRRQRLAPVHRDRHGSHQRQLIDPGGREAMLRNNSRVGP